MGATLKLVKEREFFNLENSGVEGPKMSENNQKEAPDHGWTVTRTILTSLITAAILWAAGNVNTISHKVTDMYAVLSTLDNQQKTLIMEQKQTHDAVLVMGATMVTKEELEKKLRILQTEVNEIERRLTQLEVTK